MEAMMGQDSVSIVGGEWGKESIVGDKQIRKQERQQETTQSKVAKKPCISANMNDEDGQQRAPHNIHTFHKIQSKKKGKPTTRQK